MATSASAVILLTLLWLANLPGNHVAGAQAKPPNLGLGDVDVGWAGEKAIFAQETVAVLDDLEDAAAKEETLLLGLRLKNPKDQVLLLQRAVAGDAKVAGQVLQFVAGFCFEFSNVHVALQRNKE